MANLEELYTSRINAKNEARNAERDKELEIKEKRVAMAQKFLDQISFLNKYGFNWKISAYCNNGHDCCMGYYAWNVKLVNNTMATNPFEKIIVDEINGEIKGRWETSILGHGRFVDGQDKEGWFTPRQLICALS